jgi:hypothetical protein
LSIFGKFSNHLVTNLNFLASFWSILASFTISVFPWKIRIPFHIFHPASRVNLKAASLCVQVCAFLLFRI